MDGSLHWHITMLLFRTSQKKGKEFDKAIKTQMELLPNVLTFIPGIGSVY